MNLSTSRDSESKPAKLGTKNSMAKLSSFMGINEGAHNTSQHLTRNFAWRVKLSGLETERYLQSVANWRVPPKNIIQKYQLEIFPRQICKKTAENPQQQSIIASNVLGVVVHCWAAWIEMVENRPCPGCWFQSQAILLKKTSSCWIHTDS